VSSNLDYPTPRCLLVVRAEQSMMQWLKDNAIDLMGHGLTLVGIVIATVTVILQLARQHKSSLQLQRENAREELKLRIHETLAEKVRKLSRANTRAAMYAFMIPFNVGNFQNQRSLGMNSTPVKERTPEFSKLHFEANDVLVELIEEFEAWAIAFPGLTVFQTALNSANHNAQNAFHELFSFLVPVLPFDPPIDAHPQMPRPFVPKILSDQEREQLKEHVDRYKEAMDEIGSYIHDLTIESQNNLLSGLFDRRVPVRRPLDPQMKVITTESGRAARLLHYFENETDWGRSKQAAEQDVRKALEKP
jgi:hypothetical protein